MKNIRNDPNFSHLFENTSFVLGYVFETAYLINKVTEEERVVGQFYGDPTCGLIGKNSDWCLVGGDALVACTGFNQKARPIGNLTWIYALRAIDEYKAQILLDPWSPEASIWQIEFNLANQLNPTNLFKVSDFKHYLGQPYTEQIRW